MGDLQDLYQDVILDHSKHPRNFGLSGEAMRRAKGNNPLCGDRVEVGLTVTDGVITDATFDARGCAISLASASLMTEMLKGKTEDEARELFARFHHLLTGENEPDSAADDETMGDLGALSGVRDYPTRIKCATLAWHAMAAALDASDEDVTTE